MVIISRKKRHNNPEQRVMQKTSVSKYVIDYFGYQCRKQRKCVRNNGFRRIYIRKQTSENGAAYDKHHIGVVLAYIQFMKVRRKSDTCNDSET